jgi:hypothetical protein
MGSEPPCEGYEDDEADYAETEVHGCCHVLLTRCVSQSQTASR